MNYYKRHLGDYAKDTAHLSAAEVGTYDLLLDRYYGTERPIRDDDANKIARAKTAKDRAIVRSILGEFFKRRGECWHHNYADGVIEAAHKKAGTNRENGKLGGRPAQFGPRGTLPNGPETRTQEEPKKNPEETQSVNSGLSEITLATSHKPLNQEKETTAASRPRAEFPQDFEKAWSEYPARNGSNPKGRALKAWRARIASGATPDQILSGVRRYAAWCRATGKVGLETVKQAATFFGPDQEFLAPWGIAAPPPKPIAPDCNVPGCNREGMPGLGGVCEQHYVSPRRVAA